MINERIIAEQMADFRAWNKRAKVGDRYCYHTGVPTYEPHPLFEYARKLYEDGLTMLAQKRTDKFTVYYALRVSARAIAIFDRVSAAVHIRKPKPRRGRPAKS